MINQLIGKHLTGSCLYEDTKGRGRRSSAVFLLSQAVEAVYTVFASNETLCVLEPLKPQTFETGSQGWVFWNHNLLASGVPVAA